MEDTDMTSLTLCDMDLTSVGSGEINTSSLQNSLWQMDPMAKSLTQDLETSTINNSLFQMDPLAKASASGLETSTLYNSLFQMDPLAGLMDSDNDGNMDVTPGGEGIPDISEYSDIPIESTDQMQTSMDQIQSSTEDIQTYVDHIQTSTDLTSDIQTSIYEIQPSADDVQTSADQIQTSTDDVQTSADQIKTTTDDAQTSADQIQTSTDDVQTSADRVQTSPDGIQTSTDDVQTSPDEIQTSTDDVQTSPDGIQTSTDDVQTSPDGIKTSTDDVQTSPDGIQTSTDDVQTSPDGIQTSTDDVQTSPDGIQTSTDDVQRSTDGIQTSTDDVQTSADDFQTSADNIQTFPDDFQTSIDQIQTSTDEIQISIDPPQTFEGDIKDTEESSVSKQCLIEKLQYKLRCKDEDLKLAATFGKQLLEKNTELHTQLERDMKEMSAKVEALEQERYSLQLKLEQSAKMEANYVDEIDSLKSCLKRQKKEHEEFMEVEHNNKVAELRSQLNSHQTEFEQAQLLNRQLQTQKTQLESLLQEARDQLEQKISIMNETCSEELVQLHTEVNSLQNDKITLSRELSEALNNEERYKHSLQRALSQVETKEQEVEERQVQATAYYNALEKVREEVQDLKVELDVARMESKNMRTKGNSLFSEVEDRRVMAEKELISLKVQLDSITKQHRITKQHEHALKLQMSVLLQKAGHTADVQYMERLQRQLAQARSDITTLEQKLQHVEKQPQKLNPKAELYDAWSKRQSGDDPTKMQFFEKLLENKQKEMQLVERELKTKRLMLLAQDQRVIKYESQLYDTERQLEKQRDCNIKLKLKVDELRMKYEPDRKSSGEISKKENIEKLPYFKPKSEQTDGKENKPIMMVDNWSNDKSKTRCPSGNLTTMLGSSALKPLKIGPLSKSSGAKPVLKSLQKKQVRLSEDVDIIESSGRTGEDCQAVERADHKPADVKSVDQADKGRVRGRERYNKVNVVKMDGKSEVSECNQQ